MGVHFFGVLRLNNTPYSALWYLVSQCEMHQHGAVQHWCNATYQYTNVVHDGAVQYQCTNVVHDGAVQHGR
jgi:hypothetical protein